MSKGRKVQRSRETKWNHNCRVQPSSVGLQLSARGCCGVLLARPAGPASWRTCVEELSHVGSRSRSKHLASVMYLFFSLDI